jgi:tetratricopeptide (TPR) repeat protein
MAMLLVAMLLAQTITIPPPAPSGLPDVSKLGDVLLGPMPAPPSTRPQEPMEPSVSVTILRAPKKARKAYEAGLNAAAQHKWSAAEKDFSGAVARYPKYAPAWDELGRVLEQEGDRRLAGAAYQRAVWADPSYARSYADLAKLAIDGGEWKLALKMSSGAIRLLAMDHPDIWLYNATAAFKLGQWETAEKSAREALERDYEHQYSVGEFILGAALDHRGDGAEAAAHYRAFLAMSPGSENAAVVRRRLAELGLGPS